MENILEIKDFSLSFYTEEKETQVLRDISLSLKKGEILAVVGESGCGKSVLCKSIMQLLPGGARRKKGSICLYGEEISRCNEKEMQKLRGKCISMIFQDPMTALNPTLTIGKQIEEAIRVHERDLTKKEVHERVLTLLELVGIEDAKEKEKLYPCHFSGGMRQRAVIAIALAASPQILLADEPTTSLDVTIQAKILKLLKEAQRKLGLSILFVTHDLGVVAGIADRVAVMYEGRIIEKGMVEEIFYQPKNNYTKTLIRSHPYYAGRKEENRTMDREILLEVQNVSFSYIRNGGFGGRKRACIKAVDQVSFQIKRGEIFGLVGESGSGKSTLARLLMNLYVPQEGRIIYQGIDLGDKRQFRMNRRLLETARQLIFQDSNSSLNGRMKVSEIIEEPMRLAKRIPPRGSWYKEAAFQLLHLGMDSSCLDCYPFQLSGGMRQRVAIARALTMEPDFLVADEPLASLDVVTQVQLIELFRHLQQEHGFTFLLIAHDLEVIRCLCDRVGVMYKGRLVEVATAEKLFEAPEHPYTKALLSAIPVPDPKRYRSLE
ncbi:MAG: dipeptide ABC transporter ATP-binding protein [Lachnospiraceae bacterium]